LAVGACFVYPDPARLTTMCMAADSPSPSSTRAWRPVAGRSTRGGSTWRP